MFYLFISYTDLASYKKATTTKAVFGITIDPLGENRLASFFEGVVTIWDSRNFDKPISFYRSSALGAIVYDMSKFLKFCGEMTIGKISTGFQNSFSRALKVCLLQSIFIW